MLSMQILGKPAGAMLSKPCHLQVQDVSVPASVLFARWEVMVLAKAVVKTVTLRHRKESRVDKTLRRRSLGER